MRIKLKCWDWKFSRLFRRNMTSKRLRPIKIFLWVLSRLRVKDYVILFIYSFHILSFLKCYIHFTHVDIFSIPLKIRQLHFKWKLVEKRIKFENNNNKKSRWWKCVISMDVLFHSHGNEKLIIKKFFSFIILHYHLLLLLQNVMRWNEFCEAKWDNWSTTSMNI